MSFKILKCLFDALTSIIKDQTNIKLVSVAISIYYYDYRRNGFLTPVIDAVSKSEVDDKHAY